MGSRDADRKPLYFISYAHDRGKDDGHVQEFYQGLDHDVRMFAGLRGDEPAGFCDASIGLGHRWSPALINSLSTAQVFVPIFSPLYFVSEACGKEWTIFTSRLAGGASRETSASSIIPLIWVPLTVPPIAQDYQYSDASFGDTYKTVKLRALVRERRYTDEYHSFVQLLAQRIVDLNKGPAVAEAVDRPAFDSVRPAFPGPASSHWTDGRSRQPDPPRQTPVQRPSSDRPILNTFRPNEEPT